MMKIEEKAIEILTNCQIITIASIDENGFPRPVPVAKLKNEGEIIYFSTGTSSAKTKHFEKNPKAGISILEGGDSICYTGNIEIVKDIEIKKSLWGDWMLPHFPLGVEDPEYCVMKFTPTSSTLWIDDIFVKDGKYINRFCQSCGMPMYTDEFLGTNSDGSFNEDYCCYCYKDGKFTQDCNMEEMIQHCLNYLDEFNKNSNQNFNKEEAIAQMRNFFPLLKRWKKE